MSTTDFSHFFSKAFPEPRHPYGYQCRLACGPAATPDTPATLTRGTDCASRLIDIPTGLGKTAAVTLAWLWNRVHLGRGDWPRRLVYCLPMRTLVEQTHAEAGKWVDSLAEAGLLPQRPGIHILMGGEDAGEWDIYPERDAILIGTQDMLLSRALNRGYGMSRYRWPMHFGLLNNDCLWVMDEVQLMGPGLAATTQLEGFRTDSTLGSHNCYSWWMSATIRADWLGTVDVPETLLNSDPLRLSADERQLQPVLCLRTAPKQLIASNTKSGNNSEKDIAEYILNHRSAQGINLVVVNTVKRSQAIHQAIEKRMPKGAAPSILLHSRFRPQDRLRVLDAVRSAAPGTIVVSTQVIEAGVNLSCHSLFTEIAPWSSMVQRFGRCNRWLNAEGSPHFNDASVHWFDLDSNKEAAPYAAEQLDAARGILAPLTSAAIVDLETIGSPDADRPDFRHVVRRKDLLEIFDTTPDIAGADLDIDRFIRDADQSHVQVFWRRWDGSSPNGPDESSETESPPSRDELCPTSIGDLAAFLKKAGQAWRWSPLDKRWLVTKSDDLVPGQVYLLHSTQGGYMQGEHDRLPLGWTGDPKSTVHPLPAPVPSDNSYDGDPASVNEWESIGQHTNKVCNTLASLLQDTESIAARLATHLAEPSATLEAAARWHDWGKAHPAFQAKLDPAHPAPDEITGAVAKAPKSAWRAGRLPARPKPGEIRRPHFRHELASALAVLHPDSGFPITEPLARDLAAYLIAAHHGKIRLSIRSLPDEWMPPADEAHPDGRRFARGVWDNDVIPATDLGCGIIASCVPLSLEPMELGLCEAHPFTDQPSWIERMLSLRDILGPFCLAYLEALIRAADARASHTSAPNNLS